MFPTKISLTEPGGFDAARMTQFVTTDVADIDAFTAYLVTFAWSGCVWRDGRRLRANFVSSDWCALDFDDGRWTVGDALQTLKHNELYGIIGTTKSHQKSKNEAPACDRFRLIMPWNGQITSRDAYEQNMRRLMEHMPVDKACKDAGRFFWPCEEIVHVVEGAALDWLPYEAPKPRVPSRSVIHDASLGQVPQWMEAKLKHVRPGERNKTAFYIACRLKERGWSQSKIAELLLDHIDLDRREIERTVLSAWSYT